MRDDAVHMKLFERRALTAGECALVQELFGAGLDARRVRVMQIPALGFWAMVPFGRTIVYSRLPARRDFTTAPLHEQGVFVHELVHVWQAARGAVLALAKLSALGRNAYRYAAQAGADFQHYNIESQAEIVRHLFLARRGACEADMGDPAWLEEIWRRASLRG